MENNDITANNPPSAASSAPPQTQQSNPPQDESPLPPGTTILQDLHSYPFNSDEEFKIGLAVIRGHPNTPPTEEELRRNDDLALQARCFYYSRKKGINPPIDFSTYKTWLSSLSASSTESQPATAMSTSASVATEPGTAATTTSTSFTTQTSTTTEPSYPSSFAHIVELITTGQPVPGIQQIPDTVLTGKEAPSTAAKRRKPWEKDDDSSEAVKDDGQEVGT